MEKIYPSRPKWVVVMAVVAALFGLLTIYSGGAVVLFDGPARVAAGNYVPFVVWFNFLAGFAYVVAGLGLYFWRRWAVCLSMAIAVGTVLIFAGLGISIMLDGAYEMRTVVAMVLRSAVWMTIAYMAQIAWRKSATRA
ncbi:MAG: hypothetical protein ACTSUY_01490 [Alphaproteobacteria bacterium]